MAVRMEIDTKAFSAAMKKYQTATGKTSREIINKKGYFIVRNAMQRTRKADVKKIRKFFRKANQHEWSPYVRAYFGLQKGTPPWELAEYAKKLKALKAKSVGYLRAGWIVALRAFGAASKQKKTFRGVKMVGRPKGKARVCKRPNRDGTCEGWMKNTIGHGGKDHAKALSQWGKPALRHAVRDEAKSMKRYAERKHAETQRRHRVK